MAKMKHPKMLLFPFEVASFAIQIAVFIKAKAMAIGSTKNSKLRTNNSIKYAIEDSFPIVETNQLAIPVTKYGLARILFG